MDKIFDLDPTVSLFRCHDGPNWRCQEEYALYWKFKGWIIMGRNIFQVLEHPTLNNLNSIYLDITFIYRGEPFIEISLTNEGMSVGIYIYICLKQDWLSSINHFKGILGMYSFRQSCLLMFGLHKRDLNRKNSRLKWSYGGLRDLIHFRFKIIFMRRTLNSTVLAVLVTDGNTICIKQG